MFFLVSFCVFLVSFCILFGLFLCYFWSPFVLFIVGLSSAIGVVAVLWCRYIYLLPQLSPKPKYKYKYYGAGIHRYIDNSHSYDPNTILAIYLPVLKEQTHTIVENQIFVNATFKTQFGHWTLATNLPLPCLCDSHWKFHPKFAWLFQDMQWKVGCTFVLKGFAESGQFGGKVRPSAALQ